MKRKNLSLKLRRTYSLLPLLLLFNLPLLLFAQSITGKVTTPAGDGISGASVQVKGTSKGALTDQGGNFSLNGVNTNATLVVSSLGYTTQQISLGGRSNVTVALVEVTKAMEQVVVVGYGAQRKIDVTGSVTNVKGEEISKQASINPISALQGKVAGVQITNSGSPGSSPQIRIRGLGTVYGNPNPLYVVDGVWFDDISFLNPADIDNVSILKDASSEAIYGIRAANGVVLITTKKGRPGQPVVNYNGYVGWQKVTDEIKMANASEFVTLINEQGTQVFDPAAYANVTGTDWYHQILRDAFVTNHQVSVSGGSTGSTYNLSLGYLNQEGIVKTNEYTRYTAKLQNDFQIFKSLKAGYVITGNESKSSDINGSIFHQLYAASPIVPVRYQDGSYGDPNDFVGLSSSVLFNPQVTIDYFNQRSRNYRLTGNGYVDLKFARHFTFHSSIGGEFGQSQVRNYLPVFKATFSQQNDTSILTLTRGEVRNWILENTLTFDTKINDHSIKVLAGQSAQRYQSYGITASAKGVPNTSEGDLYLRRGYNTTGIPRSVDDQGDISTVTSYFGRITYSFKNRYLMNVSMRADGSSKFSGDNRWGYFPSVGIGWVISDESFMQNQKLFNSLKLRGSWGKVGNASVPANLSVLPVNQGAYLTAIFGGQTFTGASITSVVPPTTYWERGVGTDVGLEGSLMNNKLYVEAGYYIKKTEKAIFAIPILGSIGTNSGTIVGNQADFENRGWEFTATWKDKISNKVSYSISGNLGINHNKVLSVVTGVGSSRVDLQACKLEYSIVSPK